MSATTKTGQQVAGDSAICPNCGRADKLSQRVRYGQRSYSCDACRTWGPWRDARRAYEKDKP